MTPFAPDFALRERPTQCSSPLKLVTSSSLGIWTLTDSLRGFQQDLAARNRWDTDWTRKWFYHKSPAKDGLRSHGGLIQLVASPEIVPSSREDALLNLLLDITKRLSTRDLVEEFCAFRIWPLAKEWKVKLGASAGGLASLTSEGRTGKYFFFKKKRMMI